MLWLTTLVFGAVLIVLYTALLKSSAPASSWFALGPLMVISLTAAIFSWPVLFVLPASIEWAFRPIELLQRHLRLLVVLSSLFAMAAFIACLIAGWFIWIFTESSQSWLRATRMLNITIPYLPATFLAAYWLYAKWLFPIW
jgi:hypothetical protein